MNRRRITSKLPHNITIFTKPEIKLRCIAIITKLFTNCSIKVKLPYTVRIFIKTKVENKVNNTYPNGNGTIQKLPIKGYGLVGVNQAFQFRFDARGNVIPCEYSPLSQNDF